MNNTVDYLVIGAGIVGLALARELRLRHPSARITVLEKESRPGLHASGRNSGVLHAGIYYPKGSLKAELCARGSRELAEYCERNGLPLSRTGKIVVPVSEEGDAQLEVLVERARACGVEVSLLDRRQLAEMEPAVRSASGRALFSPRTSVVDPARVVAHVADRLVEDGVDILTGRRVIRFDMDGSTVRTQHETIRFGWLLNAAGLHADEVARQCGVADRYTILPFKGIYYRLDPRAGIGIRRLIYPVPDLRVPFLGVHFTKSIDGQIHVGPSAMPAFGRENYHGLRGVSLRDGSAIMFRLMQQYMTNHQGFRQLLHREARHMFRRYFAEAARKMVPELPDRALIPGKKVGIRAQLLDRRKRELVMDFLVERAGNTTHVLNAVSPAFTSAFGFSRHVLDRYVD